MALSDKNIVITPNISAASDPKIVFSGADAYTAAQNITLTAYPTANGTLSFDGSAGQLFSITNSLSGSIFSVNDVSGIPSIEVLDTGAIKLAQYGGNVGVGVHPSGTYKLEVLGNISGNTITSTVSNGTAPFVVTSNTVVTNLNADLLDGLSSLDLKAYTDSVVSSNNTTLTTAYKSYTDSVVSSNNVSLKAYTDSVVSSNNSSLRANDGITLASAKSYTDAKNTFSTLVNISNDLIVTGNLTIQGTTTTLNSTTLRINDKNLELANVATPTNTTADGGGITVIGATNKTFNWVNSTGAWTSSENLDLASGKSFSINGVTVLTGSTLGSGVTSSSLTSVGTITSGVWNAGSVTASQLTSTVATGTAPFVVTSTTAVANLSIGGSAGSTTAAVTFTNTGGAAGGTTFNGSTARTIDYSTLGAAALAQIMYIGTTSVAINRSSADLALTGITSVTGTSTLTLNSTTTSALTIDSTTTGAINIGTNANAKTITLGNVTGATGLVVNTGTGGTTFNTLAAGFVKHAATVAPTVDMFQITNVGFPVVTAGVSSAQITFVGGSAAVEASANRVDITPGTLTGGTWNAYRVVSAAAATTGVTLNGIKFDSMTAGTGSDNALYVGTGWDNILNYNGTSVINGTGNLIAGQLTGQVSVSNGGTGSSSLTTNNVLLGNGTSALQVVAPGTSGNVLTSNGLTWISSTPASSSLPSQSGNGGKYLKTDGTTASWTDTLTAVKLSAYREVVVTVGTVSTSTYNIDLSLGNVFDITLGINVTFTFTNPPAAGFLANCTIILRQNATGSKTATFTGSKYTDGVAPILSTGANQIDVLSFVTVDGGTSYFGSFVLANLF